MLGEHDKAIGLIEEEYRRGADWLPEIAYTPWFDAIRTNPRVESILKKIHAIP
jgi:hypothetical protein